MIETICSEQATKDREVLYLILLQIYSIMNTNLFYCLDVKTEKLTKNHWAMLETVFQLKELRT